MTVLRAATGELFQHLLGLLMEGGITDLHPSGGNEVRIPDHALDGLSSELLAEISRTLSSRSPSAAQPPGGSAGAVLGPGSGAGDTPAGPVELTVPRPPVTGPGSGWPNWWAYATQPGMDLSIDTDMTRDQIIAASEAREAERGMQH